MTKFVSIAFATAGAGIFLSGCKTGGEYDVVPSFLDKIAKKFTDINSTDKVSIINACQPILLEATAGVLQWTGSFMRKNNKKIPEDTLLFFLGEKSEDPSEADFDFNSIDKFLPEKQEYDKIIASSKKVLTAVNGVIENTGVIKNTDRSKHVVLKELHWGIETALRNWKDVEDAYDHIKNGGSKIHDEDGWWVDVWKNQI